MKRLILMTSSVILAVSAFLVAGCAREELPDNRDMDYGYVQFKLYKEASYGNVTKAAGDYDLDSLSQASKINVMLTNSAGRTISQTLTLTASDNAAAEFGLRSAKLRLLQGDYEVASYALYNNLDTQIGNRVAVARPLTVVSGGLEIFDLTADVAPRGMIRFNLVKDLSGLNPELGLRDRRDGGYTFDEIASMNITIIDIVDQTQRVTYNGIPVTFSVHFSGDEHYDGEEGVTGEQTSSSQADSIVYAPAGSYKILSYELLDSDDIPLETQDFSDSFEEQENTIEVSITMLCVPFGRRSAVRTGITKARPGRPVPTGTSTRIPTCGETSLECRYTTTAVWQALISAVSASTESFRMKSDN